MPIRLGKNAYETLIKEDIEWLENATPNDNSLEKQHILEVLKGSVDLLYSNHSFIEDKP